MDRYRGTWAALCLALACAAAPAQPVFRSTQAAPRVEYWQNREASILGQLQARDQLGAIRLVFLGDSLTDFWSLRESPWHKGQRFGRAVWDEAFGPAAGVNRALNMGISGDRLEHVLQRLLPRAAGGLGQLDAPELDPDFVVLLIGINNSWDAEEPAADSIFDGIRAVVGAVHARKPRARIVLQTLLPTNEPDRNREVVQPVNRSLAAWVASPAQAGYLSLLDLHGAFLDREGRQIPNLFADGLHPNEAGYRVWRDRLVPFLAQERQRRTP